MTDNIENSKFITLVSQSLINEVVIPICNFYKTEKGCDVDYKDICKKVLNIPQDKINSSQFFNSVKISSATPNGRPRARKNKKEITEQEQCEYILTRGNDRGKRCKNPKKEGLPVCKTCEKKSKGKELIERYKKGLSTSPTSSEKSPSHEKLPSPPPQEESENSLSVKKWTDKNGDEFYITADTNKFIVMTNDKGSVTVLGVEDGDTYRKLSEKECEIAINKNLSIAADAMPETKNITPLVETEITLPSSLSPEPSLQSVTNPPSEPPNEDDISIPFAPPPNIPFV